MEDLVALAPLKTFYRGRRVFLTGHTGFKGSWLSIWLQSLGADVTGFALEPETTPNLFEAAHIKDSLRSVIGDVRDASALAKALRQAQPDIVLHLAAQSLVRRSYRDPVGTYATNVMGTLNLLEAVRFVPSVRALLVVTSDKCYENREWIWGHRENEAMGGADPYSSSKGCAELVTAAYRHSFFKTAGAASIASARAGNVIGGGDWSEDRLVPDIARSLAAGQRVVLRNPDSIRPWQHVLEPLHGYLLLCQRLYSDGPDWAEAWNFGPAPDTDSSVEHVTRLVLQCWGKGEFVVKKDPQDPGEAVLLRLDSTKAARRLGWRSRLPLAEVVRLTVEVYRAFEESPERVREIVEGQILAYCGSLK